MIGMSEATITTEGASALVRCTKYGHFLNQYQRNQWLLQKLQQKQHPLALDHFDIGNSISKYVTAWSKTD